MAAIKSSSYVLGFLFHVCLIFQFCFCFLMSWYEKQEVGWRWRKLKKQVSQCEIWSFVCASQCSTHIHKGWSSHYNKCCNAQFIIRMVSFSLEFFLFFMNLFQLLLIWREVISFLLWQYIIIFCVFSSWRKQSYLFVLLSVV